MSDLLARLVARSVHPPRAGRYDVGEALPSVTGGGPGAVPAGEDPAASSIRPRLPSRYERTRPGAVAGPDAEVGPEGAATRGEHDVTAPTGEASPGGRRRDQSSVTTGRVPAGPAATRDLDATVPVALSRERGRPADERGARVRAQPPGVPVAGETPADRAADDAAERRTTRRDRKGLLAPSAGWSDPTGTFDAVDAFDAVNAADRPTPAASAGAKGGGATPSTAAPRTVDGPRPSADGPPAEPGGGTARPARHAPGSPVSDLRPREPGPAAARPPGEISPRPASDVRGRPGTPAAPGGPRIRVSIGRVEVRAVHAPPTPAPSAELRRAAGPTTSLDQYLERREGRG